MPDRSVSVVVDESREKARDALKVALTEWGWGGDVAARDADALADAVFAAAGVPAMVEALAPFAALAKRADAFRHEPGSSCTWRIDYDDLARARAVLGGEVQGRADTSEPDVAVFFLAASTSNDRGDES